MSTNTDSYIDRVRPVIEKQARIVDEMREIAEKAIKIGLDYPDSGLTVSNPREGMVVELNYQGQQVRLDDMPQDVLEEKWPGLSDRLSMVLDEENVLWQKWRNIIQERKATRICRDYPDLEITILDDRDGIVLMVEHDGHQVDFNNMRFDVLEEKWPSLSDRLSKVLDDEMELQRSREVLMENRVDPTNCSIIAVPGNRVSREILVENRVDPANCSIIAMPGNRVSEIHEQDPSP